MTAFNSDLYTSENDFTKMQQDIINLQERIISLEKCCLDLIQNREDLLKKIEQLSSYDVRQVLFDYPPAYRKDHESTPQTNVIPFKPRRLSMFKTYF